MIDTSPQAFPVPETERSYFAPGMSLRDWFAGQALAGFCANCNAWSEKPFEDYAALAYAMADDMLDERKGEAAQ